MISGKELKRDTQLIIISVLVLVLATMGVSYSAFFSVKTQTYVQEITTGELNVTITKTAMTTAELMPTPTAELPTATSSVANGAYASITLENKGSLPAEFSVAVGNDIASGKSASDYADLTYLKIGVYDWSNRQWVKIGNAFNISIKGLTPSTLDANLYPILNNTIPVKAASGTAHIKEYRIYVWLDENTPTEQIGKLVSLKLDVKSATVNGKIGKLGG